MIFYRRLLWHGSRMTNWMGILGRGLKIAPPEAPCSGYMFGKGVYFADCASKSANYTYANISNNVGLMALCEVSFLFLRSSPIVTLKSTYRILYCL